MVLRGNEDTQNLRRTSALCPTVVLKHGFKCLAPSSSSSTLGKRDFLAFPRHISICEARIQADFLPSYRGVINSYGVYQTYYEQSFLRSSGSSAISWIGSLQTFSIMIMGCVTGPIYDAGYFHHLLCGGTFLVAVGHMMLSLCHEYWQVLLAQSFCIGLGSGALFVPGVAILPSYFSRKISLAIGLAASGASIGGVIYPVMFRRLQPRIGFPWSVRIIGFTAFGGLLLSNLVMKVRVPPAQRRNIIDWAAFRESPYLFFNIALFVAFMGAYTPFYYVQLLAAEHHITTPDLAFYLIAILNATSTVGRIVPNYAADKLGPFNMMIPCAITCGILILCLLSISTQGPLIAFVALYGFFSGSFVSLTPSILFTLSPNRGVLGTRMGMCFAVMGIALLIGTPIAGAILDGGGYPAVWIYGGVLTTVGGGLLMVSRGFKVGWQWAKIA